MSTHITAYPAYGRTYPNQAAVKAAWAANKDFGLGTWGGGPYVNRQDAIRQDLKVVVSFTNRSGGSSYVKVN